MQTNLKQRTNKPVLRAASLAALSVLGIGLSGASATAQGIGVTVNGNPVVFKGLGPQQIQGRVLVPVRGVLEKLGANVAWVPKSRLVIASTPTMDIQIRLGERQAVVNGQTLMLDVPAQEIGGSTFVPLRFLGQSLGAKINWDGQTQTVQIITKDQINALPPGNAGGQSAAAPVIDEVTSSAKGWLKAGDSLEVGLNGTPGGLASFRIPGLIDNVAMRETSPGRYVGSWKVPADKAVRLTNTPILGSLRKHGQAAPVLQTSDKLAVDSMPPRLRDRSPEPNSLVVNRRPNIYAVFEDDGSGLKPESVRVLLDGKNVTAQANVTRSFFSFTPAAALAEGKHTIQVTGTDKAGNAFQSLWAFTQPAKANGGIKSVSANANQKLEPGDTLQVSMLGAPGGRASFTLGNIKEVPMHEDKAGAYVASYTIKKGDNTAGGRLMTHLVTADGEKYEHQAEENIVVRTGPPAAPVITSPKAGTKPASPLIIQGTATPNSQVHITVEYAGKAFGLLSLRGSAADVIVTADKKGNWKTEPVSLNTLLGSRNLAYTISATATNEAEEQSKTTTLVLK